MAHIKDTTCKKAFKYRLYPTQPQARDLERTLDSCRQLYNAALQERRDAYRKAGKTVSFYEQKKWLPEYQRIHSRVLQNVIERVDKAFQGFFRRVKQGQTPGYPRFKGRERYDSFTFPQAGTTGVKLQEGGKEFRCSGCGGHFHRDVAAALNVLTRARTEPAGMGTAWAVP